MKPAVTVRIKEFEHSVVKRQGSLVNADHFQSCISWQQRKITEFHNNFARLNTLLIWPSSSVEVKSTVSFFTKNITSNPFCRSGIIFSTIARMRRFNLLRTTAFFETFTPTTTANLESGSLFFRNLIPRELSKTLFPREKSVLMSVSFRNRFTERNMLNKLFFACSFDRKRLSSFSASSRNHVLAVFCTHSFEKPMCFQSNNFLWLMSSFWHIENILTYYPHPINNIDHLLNTCLPVDK